MRFLLSPLLLIATLNLSFQAQANEDHLKIFDDCLAEYGFTCKEIEQIPFEKDANKFSIPIRDFNTGVKTGAQKTVQVYSMSQIRYLLSIAEPHGKKSKTPYKDFTLLEIVKILENQVYLSYEFSLSDKFSTQQKSDLDALSRAYAQTAKVISERTVHDLCCKKYFYKGVQLALVVGTCYWIRWMINI